MSTQPETAVVIAQPETTVATTQLETTVAATTTKGKGKGKAKGSRGKNWIVDEDIQLCKSWIHISEDPSTGDDQDLKEFWGRILLDYDEHKLSTFEERTSWENLYNRFKIIQKQVSGYCGHYGKAQKTVKSGANPLTDTVIHLYTIIIIKSY